MAWNFWLMKAHEDSYKPPSEGSHGKFSSGFAVWASRVGQVAGVYGSGSAVTDAGYRGQHDDFHFGKGDLSEVDSGERSIHTDESFLDRAEQGRSAPGIPGNALPEC